MIDDLASPELAEKEKLDRDDTLEKVRSGDGQEEMETMRVGETDGDGDKGRASGGGVVAVTACSSIIALDERAGTLAGKISRIPGLQNQQIARHSRN
jgi:hypothetical protein